MLVRDLGFESRLSASSAQRFHQISLSHEFGADIGYRSAFLRRWRLTLLPLNYIRLVGIPWIEHGMHTGAGFTDPLSHQTWRYPFGLVACVASEKYFLKKRNLYPVFR